VADRKITDLTALTTPASADVLPIVDVSEAAAADKNKKITVGELFKGVPDGTAAAPAIAFESDDGNGIFLSTTDTVGIATNGSSRMTVSTTAVTSTLPVIVPDGTAAAPSVAFTGSGTDTGIYSPGVDQVAVATNGTGRLFVDHHVTQYLTSTKAYNATPGGGLALYYKYNSANAYTYGAGVSFEKDNTSDGDYGSHLTLQTRANGGNATERLRITSGGLVGIGTGLPSGFIHIQGTSTGTETYGRFTTGSASGDQSLVIKSGSSRDHMAIQVSTNAGAADDLALQPDGGRVGIGTNSPTNKLVVSDGGNGGFEVAPGASDIQTYSYNRGTSAYITHTDLASAFIWSNGAAERARIDSSGRLLVGTSTARSNFFNTASSAPQQLQVEGTTGNTCSLSSICSVADTSGGRLLLAHQRSGAVGGNTILNSGDQAGYITFQGNDGGEFVECASIEAVVDGTPGANDMPGRLMFSTTADGASSPTERMRINNAGSVNIFEAGNGLANRIAQGAGTTYQLFVGLHTATNTGNGTVSFRVYSNGNVQNTNNSYTAISDIKLKENIVDANSQWDDLKALRVRNYNLKEGQTHTQIGLVAQEVEPISPGLVYESPDRDEDGNDLGTVTKSVNYSVLYMKAVKALQEAMERIPTPVVLMAALVFSALTT
jgi:hypothetical protein